MQVCTCINLPRYFNKADNTTLRNVDEKTCKKPFRQSGIFLNKKIELKMLYRTKIKQKFVYTPTLTNRQQPKSLTMNVLSI